LSTKITGLCEFIIDDNMTKMLAKMGVMFPLCISAFKHSNITRCT